VFGFDVYTNFETDEVAHTGIMCPPGASDRYVGGHAVVAVGYDEDYHPPLWDAPGGFLVRNSWGSSWGQGGYFWMPKSYVVNPVMCDDFWVIREVSCDGDASS